MVIKVKDTIIYGKTTMHPTVRFNYSCYYKLDSTIKNNCNIILELHHSQTLKYNDSKIINEMEWDQSYIFFNIV